MKRIVFTTGIIALIFGSLIRFPGYIVWMISLWATCSLIAGVKQKPMWPWLVGVVLITAIKRPGVTIEFWIFSMVFVVVAAVDWQTMRKKAAPLDFKRWAISACILMIGVTQYGVNRWMATTMSQIIGLDERPIACLGDSLTAKGYPIELKKLVSVDVIDFGVDGIKTDDGIKMIPAILETNPQLVVIELGGHDYNADHRPRSETKSNLIEIIEAFRKRNVHIILIEIPRGFISDPYDGLEREIADDYDLQLIDDSVIRSFVFNSSIMPPGLWLDPSRRYSDDGLHPNQLGKKHLAMVVSRALTNVSGRSILK